MGELRRKNGKDGEKEQRTELSPHPRKCHSCVDVGGETKAQADLKHEGEEMFETTIYGSTAEMIDITNMDLSEGRFFVPYEVEHSMPLCVIGQDVKDKFYPNVDPIGKTLRIQNAEMTIIGVLEKLGSMFGQSMDNRIYVPLTIHRQIFGKQNDFGIRGSAQS
jgi:putative ABC transport system permease protein